MSIDFNVSADRRNSESIKWRHYPEDVIPMWVADMDFKAPEQMVRALHARVDHGVFGYEVPSTKLQETIVAWLSTRYGWEIKTEDLVFMPGLVSGLNVVSRAYGYVGDNVVTQTPVYGPFLSAPVNQGLALKMVPMRQIAGRERVEYDVDYEALEKAFNPRTALYLHCHPHNPAGREFTQDENRRIGEICLKNNAVIVSDEIHCDLLLDGTKHVPMAMTSPEVAQRTVTLMAPSKAFNIPGLGCSYAIVQNPALRRRLNHAKDGIIPMVNALGLAATEVAYSECGGWLQELCQYLTENRNVLLDYVDENMPGVKISSPNSTYLGWLDVRSSGIVGNPYDFFLNEAKVALNDGLSFGPAGEGFVRLNFGCPRPQMLEALDRMQNALKTKV